MLDPDVKEEIIAQHDIARAERKLLNEAIVSVSAQVRENSERLVKVETTLLEKFENGVNKAISAVHQEVISLRSETRADITEVRKLVIRTIFFGLGGITGVSAVALVLVRVLS